jgi:hypothetical protein
VEAKPWAGTRVNRWKASCRGDRARNREADDPAVRAPCAEGGTAVGGGGVRGWLRLAGGDNAIGMIWGDLVGSEQSEVRERASRWLAAGGPGEARSALGGPVGRRCDNPSGKRQPMPSEESDGS